MKRILALTLLFVFSFVLTACDFGGDDVPEICPTGQHLEGTTCVDDEVDPVVCETGYTEVDGNCVEDDPDPLVCETGTHEENGACVTDPLVCPTGQHEENDACVVDTLVCETGTHEENGACVIDPLVCETGTHEENGACVIDALVCETGTHEEEGQCVLDTVEGEALVDYIVNNWDGTMALLAAPVAAMDFSTGYSMTYEFDFEVTEDIDETHYIEAMITDHFVTDEVNGNMMQRDIMLDIDGEESFAFAMIYHEVETGVHLYVQPALFYQAMIADDEYAETVLDFLSLDSEWALFKFDDSLDSVIQVEVIKEMMVSLFFSEMGEQYFYLMQEELEMEIGFDLTQYGVDFGQFIDYMIEEDFTNAELLLEGVDEEAIVLHLDHMYLAPQLHMYLLSMSTELSDAGFDINKIATLDTGDYNEVTDMFDVDIPIDPLKGTEAFFNSLTVEEQDIIVEVIIKPIVEAEIFYNFEENFDDSEAMWRLEDLLWIRQYELEGEFGVVMSEFVNELHIEGPLEFWNTLTQEQRDYFYQMAEEEYMYYDSEWIYDIIWDVESLGMIDDEVLYWINMHTVELTAAGYDVTQIVTDIQTYGAEEWYYMQDETFLEGFMDFYVYPELEEFHMAVNDGEVAEWLMTTLFTDPHVLAELGPGMGYDETIIAANMMLIDFDMLVMELMYLEDLNNVIYDGQDAFDLYVIDLATDDTLTDPEDLYAPNAALLLAIWSPAVLEFEPVYDEVMMYVDELQYAIEALDVFAQYATLDYYIENDVLDMNIEKSDDITVRTMIELDGLSYATIFSDLKDDLNSYLGGFTLLDFPYDENWECIDLEDEYCDDIEMSIVMATLIQQGSVFVNVEYDPNDLGWMSIELDATDLANVLLMADYAMFLSENPGYVPNEYDDMLTGVTNLTFKVTMNDNSNITLPTEVDDVNMIAEDFARMLVASEGLNIVENVAYYYEDNPTELLSVLNTDVSLDDILSDFMVSEAFDKEMSYVSISLTDFELVLYWIDGTEVFDTPFSLTTVSAYWVDGDLTETAGYDLMVDVVDDENFNLTKVWLMLLLQDQDDYYYEEDYYYYE